MKNILKIPLAFGLTALMCSMGCQQTSQNRSSADGSYYGSRNSGTSQQTSHHRPHSGTSQQASQHRPVAEAPAPPPKPTPAPAPKVGCSEATGGLVRMSKTMPAEANLGSEFMAELNIVAQGCAGNVVVRDAVPDGASFVRSEPAATVEGNQLVWKIGNMDAGQTINAKVWFKADKEGTLLNCAIVSADPRVCGSTFVGKAMLTIQKTGPETANMGSDVTYSIVVKNTGTSIAKNVMLVDAVPEGMSGQPLNVNLGDLAPGQSKTTPVTFKATKRGKVCNTASANSGNTTKVTSEACTVVLVPGLKVEKTGMEKQILGREADYQIVVSNTGDTVLKNVVVTDTAPTDNTIASAPGATIAGNKATWTIAELKPGAKHTASIKLGSKVAGTHCNKVTATSGTLSDSAEACTVWRGIAGVLLEVVDDPDPIQVGETTTYTIKVTNQGFAAMHNLKIVANFATQVTPTATAQGTISGKTVTFPNVPSLEAKGVLTYKITVKGASVGDSRNKIALNADELQTPVDEEESTTVY